MIIARGVQNLPAIPVSGRTVVTIGNFDGVHLGHQAIIRLAVEKARAAGSSAIAFTFRPHPQQVLRPDGAGPMSSLITTYDEKLSLLEALGADIAIEQPFDRDFASLGPEAFFNDILRDRLRARAIVVGYDFSFGRDRSGQLAVLSELCARAGVELSIVPPQSDGGEAVSSSRIRLRLREGDVAAAALLLGRPFSYSGKVVRGDARGRQLGFPTANVEAEAKLALPYGVYATWMRCKGERWASVTNVGVRPTFASSAVSEVPVRVETHLIDRSMDLYGETVEVQFVKRLREEKRFAGLEELKAQIARDVEEARAALS